MSDFLSISEVADKFGVQPRAVSDLFYRRKLDVKKCLIKANRRLVPESLLPQIERLLKRKATK